MATSAPVSQPSGRVIIVVPRHDPKLYAYLQGSFSQAADIEVVLDRRAAPASAAAATTPDLRRRSGTRNILGGLTIASAAIRAASPIEKSPEPPAVPAGRPRLWPTLEPKDFTLVIPEIDPNAEQR